MSANRPPSGPRNPQDRGIRKELPLGSASSRLTPKPITGGMGCGKLTSRQLECLRLVATGKSDREISSILGIKEDTVHKHVEAAKQRFMVATRIELVVRALLHGELVLRDLAS